MRRKRLVLAAVVTLFGIIAAAAYAAHPSTSAARANQGADSAVGAWHVTVNVDGSPTPFDTLYLFTRGGGFVRIDGRNDVPGLGNWTESTENRVALTVVLFSFDASGHRVGTIRSNMLAWVRDGVLSGTFAATGVDLAGNPLPGFPKTGTFTGDRIEGQAP